MPKLSVKMSIFARDPAANDEEEAEDAADEEEVAEEREADDDNDNDGAARKRHKAAVSKSAPNFMSALLHVGRRPCVRDEMEAG